MLELLFRNCFINWFSHKTGFFLSNTNQLTSNCENEVEIGDWCGGDEMTRVSAVAVMVVILWRSARIWWQWWNVESGE